MSKIIRPPRNSLKLVKLILKYLFSANMLHYYHYYYYLSAFQFCGFFYTEVQLGKVSCLTPTKSLQKLFTYQLF